MSDAAHGRKVYLVAGVTPDLVARGVRADEMVRAAAEALGGSGGGNAERAEGGAVLRAEPAPIPTHSAGADGVRLQESDAADSRL